MVLILYFDDWGDTRSMKNLIAACVSITVFGFAFGMTYPLLSLILESQGVSTRMTGINASMTPLGILLFSTVIPVASRSIGARNLAIVASLLSAVLILSYRVFPSLEAWFVLRLLQGMTISVLFVLSEAWIVGYSNDENRGRIVAIYASVLSLSFALGPALVSVTGIEGWAPFVIGSVVILIGAIPLLLIDDDQPGSHDESTTSGVLGFLPKAPLLVAGVAAFAIFDAATLSLLPVYGLRHGLSLPESTLLLTALIMGNVVLQYPIGLLADRLSRRKVLIACALVASITLLCLPWTMGTVWMWVTVVFAGATGYGVYTVSLTSLGDRFSGQELVDGTAAFATVWGLGALVGAMLGGWSMSTLGKDGLPWMMSVIFAFLFLVLIRGRGSIVRSPPNCSS